MLLNKSLFFRSIATLLIFAALPFFAANSLASSTSMMSEFTAVPPTDYTPPSPIVMLVLSRDHQLWFEAYNDFTFDDKNNPGQKENTYFDDREYYGYFDSYACYRYSAKFTPIIALPRGTKKHVCDGNTWSGNFLNWATMTRMDVVLKVLYGGKRVPGTDVPISKSPGSEATVLQRAFLPTDAHSFAKFYDGGGNVAKINQFTPYKTAITLCNTTPPAANSSSDDNNRIPSVRVAKGDYRFWSSSERFQCLWKSEYNPGTASNITPFGKNRPINEFDLREVPSLKPQADSPSKAGNDEYQMLVDVCTDTFNDGCKRYPNGKWQPIGILQEKSEHGEILFGLMTGSYKNNQSGGVLRKHPDSFGNEIVANDGSFTRIEPGIVTALDAMKIVGYNYGNIKGAPNQVDGAGTYIHGAANDKCRYHQTDVAEGDCPSWSNPLGEIHAESIRYLGGAGSSTTDYGLGGDDKLGIKVDKWKAKSLIGDKNYCTNLISFVINTSVATHENRYDLGAIGSSLNDVKKATDTIGVTENLVGNSYFIGTNDLSAPSPYECSAKEVRSLSQLSGICAEAPDLGGNYWMSGLAKIAVNKDFYPEYASEEPNPKHSIQTYGIDLITNAPEVAIQHPDTIGGKNYSVSILPSYRRLKDNAAKNEYAAPGALVDFKILDQDKYTGTFYVSWEDTEQGADYDSDVAGIIHYEMTPGAPTIEITSKIIANGTTAPALFGYVITGTTGDDGFHASSGVWKAQRKSIGGKNPLNGECNTDNWKYKDDANKYKTEHTKNSCDEMNGAGADIITKAPIVTYAMGNKSVVKRVLPTPLELAVKYGYDNRDNKAYPYASVDNPSKLREAINKLETFAQSQTSSNTEVAIDYTSHKGEGALYQASYDRKYDNGDGTSTTWTGDVIGLYIDDSGNIRESTKSGNIGNIITFGDNGEIVDSDGTIRDRRDLHPLWSARTELARIDDAHISVNRGSYRDSTRDGRFIKTWLGKAGTTSGLELDDFQFGGSGGFNDSNFGLLDTDTKEKAQAIVEFVRGKDVKSNSTRLRPLIYNDDGAYKTSVSRLGDIINSTPTVVGRPGEKYDLIYRDKDYLEYKLKHKQRRHVVYVGANDGLVHAFNAGVPTYDNDTGEFTGFKADGFPLGGELWAYAPLNLLPHLRWLKDPNYEHVFYVDGHPKVFDAKVVGVDKNDWGTLLVMGMRFGGSNISIDPKKGFNPPQGGQFGSAYMLFDVSNPEDEKGPKLLDEFRLPDNTFSTSQPALAKTKEGWFLVIGSGPTSLTDATTTGSAKIYFYNLAKRAFEKKSLVVDGGAKGVFVGDPTAIDWDMNIDNYDTEEVYFGTVAGTSNKPTGKLFKINLAEGLAKATAPTLVIDVGRPIVSRPIPANDDAGNKWIFVNTGKMMARPDVNNKAQQGLFGIIDRDKPIIFNDKNLQNVTNVKVYDNGTVEGVAGSTNFEALRANIRDKMMGWYIDYPVGDNAARGVSSPFVFGKVVFAGAYDPFVSCTHGGGKGWLYGVYYGTGTAIPNSGAYEPEVGPIFPKRKPDSKPALTRIEVEGLPTRPMVKLNPSPSETKAGCKVHDSRSVSVKISTSKAAIADNDACAAGAFESREVSWREVPTQ